MFFKPSLISAVAASAVLVNGARLVIDQNYAGEPSALIDTGLPLPQNPSQAPVCHMGNIMVYGVKEIECSRWAAIEKTPRAFASDTVRCKWAGRSGTNAIGTCFKGV
ncbi:hypothetical protein Hypma_000058 [Hypsizygus marmoreus]|uniref:Uncharacterized protein n=1 Tax=Hypsizygus marmoreus TaxID=39966 RepID=A0A369KDV3_HYPMA|nr:hypothetical protein Hypma_000058 [Hypsizygus marmoreus]